MKASILGQARPEPVRLGPPRSGVRSGVEVR